MGGCPPTDDGASIVSDIDIDETPPDAPAAPPRRRGAPKVLRVLLGIALGLLAGIAFQELETDRYESTVRLLVGPIGGERETLDAAGLLSETYADVMSSRAAVERAAAELGVVIDPDDVSALADDRSRVILLVVQDETRSVPPAVADALASDLIDLVEGSRPAPVIGEAAGTEAGQVRVLDDATNPAEPVRSSSVLILFATTLLGLVAGIVWARSSTPIRRTINNAYLDATGLQVVVAQRPAGSSGDQHDLWDLAATQIDYECRQAGGYQTVAYIPVDEDPDNASVFLNLVSAEARTGRPVQIADADPRHDAIGSLLPRLGAYSDWSSMSSEGTLGPTVHAVTEDERSLLPDGARLHVVKPHVLSDSPGAMARIERIADRLPASCLMAVLTPPMGVSPVSVSSAVVVDRVVLLVRRGQTQRAKADQALRSLQSVGVTPTAVLDVERSLSLPPVRLQYQTGRASGAGSTSGTPVDRP